MRCGTDVRRALEQLCHCTTRPALALTSASRPTLVFRLKTPWRDGTTHLVMSPREFMQRLAARIRRFSQLRLHPLTTASRHSTSAFGCPLRVGLRRPSLRIHRQKAGVEDSMPVSRHSRMSHFDPQPSFELPGSCRSAKPRRFAFHGQEADARGLQESTPELPSSNLIPLLQSGRCLYRDERQL
ncbi:MAG: transposase [Betaproteobacteria bacterium]|nr:transposase [Betaproteobacteria bacterium]